MLNFVSTIVDRSNEEIDKFIKRRIYEETGVQISNKKDILELQQQYCILLYQLNTNASITNGNFYSQFILIVDLPHPDSHGVHHLTVMGDNFRFIQREDGTWVGKKIKEPWQR